MTKPHAKTRRVLMGEALRRDCDPVLFSLGFRNPRKMDWNRWYTTRRNIYLRWHGTTFHEVCVDWARYTPGKFKLAFVTSRVERPPQADVPAIRIITHGYLQNWQAPLGLWRSYDFGPWMSPAATAALVNRRVFALNEYLLEGKPSRHVRDGRPIRIHPDDPRRTASRKIFGDPWRDPESDYVPEKGA